MFPSPRHYSKNSFECNSPEWMVFLLLPGQRHVMLTVLSDGSHFPGLTKVICGVCYYPAVIHFTVKAYCTCMTHTMHDFIEPPLPTLPTLAIRGLQGPMRRQQPEDLSE